MDAVLDRLQSLLGYRVHSGFPVCLLVSVLVRIQDPLRGGKCSEDLPAQPSRGTNPLRTAYYSQWLQPNYFDGAHKVWTKYIEPAIESKAPYIDEKTEFVVKRVRNISADDLTKLIDWVTVQGQAVVGIKVADAPAKKAAVPAAEKQEDKPDEGEEVEDKPDEAEEVLVEEEKKSK